MVRKNKKVYTGAYSRRRQFRRFNSLEEDSFVYPLECVAAMAVIPSNRTILDMGSCGGKFVKDLAKHGFKIRGIDVTDDIERITEGLVTQKDLTEDCSDLYSSVDWGIFLEVGEHVPAEFESLLIDNVSQIPTKGLIISWAPLRLNWCKGHVNCKEESYIINEFQKRGWIVNDELTVKVRSICGRHRNRTSPLTVYTK